MKNSSIFFMFFRLIIPVLFLVSCSIKQEQKYLPKSTMAAIIAEIELSQAVYKLQQTTQPIDVISISEEILKKNNTTKEEFDLSLKFYVHSPKEIDDIYNEVIAILVKKQLKI